MNKKLIAGNWKMNLTSAEAASLVESIIPVAVESANVDVLFCPSFTVLTSVRDLLTSPNTNLGAQDVFWEAGGAFTGEVSASMLLDSGCKYCIVGHSERRGRFGVPPDDSRVTNYFSDSDFAVNKKLRALLFASIIPVLCIGETLQERNENQTDMVIASQLSSALKDVDHDEINELAIAYEPVWAIGTGNSCNPEEANRISGLIYEFLKDYGIENRTRILYGGSVTSSNCKELFAQPNLNGALVGGASLKVEEFSKIIKAAN